MHDHAIDIGLIARGIPSIYGDDFGADLPGQWISGPCRKYALSRVQKVYLRITTVLILRAINANYVTVQQLDTG